MEAAKQRLTWIYTARLFSLTQYSVVPVLTASGQEHDPNTIRIAGAGTWDVTRNKVVPAGPCAPSRPDLRSIPSSLTFRDLHAGLASPVTPLAAPVTPVVLPPAPASAREGRLVNPNHLFDPSIFPDLTGLYSPPCSPFTPPGTTPAGPAGEGRFFSFEFPPPLRSTFVDLTGTPELALREGSYNPNGLKFGLSYLL